MRLIIQSGFIVVTLLIIVIGIVSLQKLQESQESQSTLVKQNIIKHELAYAMRESIRLRQISLNAMLAMDDPFKVDKEILDFYEHVGIYRNAREHLYTLPINDKEEALHQKLRELVRVSQPFTQIAVNLIQTSDLRESSKATAQAQQIQKLVLDTLDEFVALQTVYANNAINSGQSNFDDTLLIVYVIGIIVIVFTLAIGAFISRLVAKKNDELLDKNKELVLAYEEAKVANAAKSDFLSSMSHELRTPLNAILGFSQIIELYTKDENTKADSMEIINAGNHLLSLINEILDLSKIETGNIELSIETCSLNVILDNTLTLINPIAEKYSIEIDNKVSTSSNINVDEMRFKQILINILSNAIKYNSENGKVTINSSTDNNMLQLSIADTGKGLTLEQQTNAFQPFDRLGAENSSIEGAGLGLKISKDLVELMGGTISVESTVGIGSKFLIHIPLS